MSTYRDDFGKYGPRVNTSRIQKLFAKLPLTVGKKFKYVHVDPNERAQDLSVALDMLCFARIAYRVHHSGCSAPPLRALVDRKAWKTLFLDVGLFSGACSLPYPDAGKFPDLLSFHGGAVCEQFVGQHLQEWHREPELFYWNREKKNSSAEVDYALAEGDNIVPVEVKAGKAGTLKSMHWFLREKGQSLGVRLNAAPPSLSECKTSLADGNNVPYRLLSLPLYLVGQVRRVLREVG